MHEAVLFVATHAPVAATQESAAHTSSSLQSFGAPGWQLPAEQTSLSVQASPLSHCAVLFMKPQPRARLHTAVVHGFESSGHDCPPDYIDAVRADVARRAGRVVVAERSVVVAVARDLRLDLK